MPRMQLHIEVTMPKFLNQFRVLLMGLFLSGSMALSQITPEMTMSVTHFSDLQVSSSGERVLFVKIEPFKEGKRNKSIWVYDLGNKRFWPVSFSGESASSPRWMPSGEISYLTKEASGEPVLKIVSPNGGPTAIKTIEKSIPGDYVWSEDGRQLFYTNRPQTESDNKSLVVVDEGPKSQVWMHDLDSNKTTALTPSDWNISSFVLVSGRKQIVMIGNDRPDLDEFRSKILVIQNYADSAPKLEVLHDPKSPVSRLGLSPNGQEISFLASRADGPIEFDLYTLSMATKKVTNVTSAMDRKVENYIFMGPDHFLITFADQFSTPLYEYKRGQFEKIQTQGLDIGNMTMWGRHVIFEGYQGARPAEIFHLRLESRPVAITNENARWDKIQYPKVEKWTYTSFDGKSVDSLVVLPLGYEVGKHYPTIAMIHGGPADRNLNSLDNWTKILASSGYVVFLPNFRGSTGHDFDFLASNRGQWGNQDLKDILEGVQALVNRGLADSSRLGIAGWSYGGYMANMAITKTSIFSAAVSAAGISNMISEYGTQENAAFDRWYFGTPYERKGLKALLRASPILGVKNAKTPTLFIHGDQDVIDPIGQGMEMYRGLKHFGIPTKFLLYKGEGHGFGQAQNILDQRSQTLKWFDSILKSEKPQSAVVRTCFGAVRAAP